MGKYHDLTGNRYGRLVVCGRAPTHRTSGGTPLVMYRCVCDCGNDIVVRAASLTSGRTRSCGCLHDEMCLDRNTTHGGKYDRLYKVWQGIKTRCYNTHSNAYMLYGGRGIKMCEEWKDDYAMFKSWAYSNGYDENAERGFCTIDRIDVDGDYSPTNCRWITMTEQCLNRRTNRLFTYNGGEFTLKEISTMSGIEYNHLYYRCVTCKIPVDDAIKLISEKQR